MLAALLFNVDRGLTVIHPTPTAAHTPEEDTNTSDNPSFGQVLDARLNRRHVLQGVIGAAGATALGHTSLSWASAPTAQPQGFLKQLDFAAVPKSLADAVSVPPGYQVQVLYALGDPLTANTPAFKNDGSDTDYEHRAGDHHDGMEWFGLGRTGRPSASTSDRALLAMNHEATTDEKLTSYFVHPNGGQASLPRPAAETDKEMALHGLSVVEIQRQGQRWSYLKASSFNRRVTPNTPVELSGPARGNPLLVTRYAPDGTRTRGTINNCGTGKTPWGTFLSGEENWNGYFSRQAADDAARDNDKSVYALNRYGRKQGAASRHGWETAGAQDRFQRWNNSKLGASADGSDDYRNEMNTMGYIVEMDAYQPTTAVVKRTALGRYAHESATFSRPVAGQPLAIYMGDDARNEYIYKFVTSAPWDPADAERPDRLAVGSKYLDHGKLYVARFNSDGSGEWIELSLAHPAIASYPHYAFVDQADVVVHARIAADAVQATKMDRPEWCSVNPANGEIYYSLTNNSNRRVDPKGSAELPPDSANPRVYTDLKAGKKQDGNPNGHILRLRESQDASHAQAFRWDVYLFGAQSDADQSQVNLSGLTDTQDLSSPDGLCFSPYSGICWIQTDDSAYTDVSNCMMLAAVPGRVGDGRQTTLRYPRADGSTLAVNTHVGKAPAPAQLKRFLVGPRGCEITGITESPDGKALFVNIQHPGENTGMAHVNDPNRYESQWPANAGYGAGQRPRSATIVVTKHNGGRIGT
ncbi:MAG TPA: PhoX family phosphatase [Macromonas sp.]|nr:PhoX family phosphatase [Macromonas sp.]